MINAYCAINVILFGITREKVCEVILTIVDRPHISLYLKKCLKSCSAEVASHFLVQLALSTLHNNSSYNLHILKKK